MRFLGAILGSVCLLSVPASVHAQAFVSEPNSLSADFSYTFAPSDTIVTTTTGDDNPLADSQPNSPVNIHIFTLGGDYSTPLEGLAVESSIDLVGAQALDVGKGAFVHFPGPGVDDDGDLHFHITDFRGGLRYQIKAIEEYLGLAFSAAFSVPVTDYPKFGYTAPAHGLKSLYFGASVARTFDPFLPRMFIGADYEFALRERVDIDPETEKFGRNFSKLEGSLGYFLPWDLFVDAAVFYRTGHGGVTFTTVLFEPPVVLDNHDQLLDEDILLLGGDLGWQITEKISVVGGFRLFTWGKNTRDMNLFSANVSYDIF